MSTTEKATTGPVTHRPGESHPTTDLPTDTWFQGRANERHDHLGQVWIRRNGGCAPLAHVMDRSENLAWGYIGAGPHDLALSVLAATLVSVVDGWDEALAEARRHTQDFMEQVVAKLEPDWQLSAVDILTWWAFHPTTSDLRGEIERAREAWAGFDFPACDFTEDEIALAVTALLGGVTPVVIEPAACPQCESVYGPPHAPCANHNRSHCSSDFCW